MYGYFFGVRLLQMCESVFKFEFQRTTTMNKLVYTTNYSTKDSVAMKLLLRDNF